MHKRAILLAVVFITTTGTTGGTFAAPAAKGARASSPTKMASAVKPEVPACDKHLSSLSMRHRYVIYFNKGAACKHIRAGGYSGVAFFLCM